MSKRGSSPCAHAPIRPWTFTGSIGPWVHGSMGPWVEWRRPPMPSPAELATRPLVFAHRGGRSLGPENTLVALDIGFAAGADGAEFDVHLSADGHAVLMHDTTLDRTTNASGP